MWHLARKTTQTLVFLLVIAAPAAALYDVAQHARSIYGESLAARRIAEMGAVPDFLIRAQENVWGSRSRNTPPLSDSLAGSPWALRIGGYVMSKGGDNAGPASGAWVKLSSQTRAAGGLDWINVRISQIEDVLAERRPSDD